MFGTFLGGCCCCACYCARCEQGTAPKSWSANILGVDYVLTPIEEGITVHNCVYEKAFDEGSEETIGCGQAARIILNLSETISDFRWFLQVQDSEGINLHFYTFVPPTAGLVNCQETFELEKTGGSCGGSDTVVITPSEPGVMCDNCYGDSSSSGGGGVPPDDGCCTVVPAAWNISIPTPVWGDLACENCIGVSGTFHCTFSEWSPLGGARYRYTNLNWCADTAAPCVGGDAGLFLLVVFQGCSLWVNIVLERLLLDNEICAASCHARYRGPSWSAVKPIDCTAPAEYLTLTQENYPNGNSCSGRTYGTPPASFDPLCGDFRVGHVAPQTITATAV